MTVRPEGRCCHWSAAVRCKSALPRSEVHSWTDTPSFVSRQLTDSVNCRSSCRTRICPHTAQGCPCLCRASASARPARSPCSTNFPARPRYPLLHPWRTRSPGGNPPALLASMGPVHRPSSSRQHCLLGTRSAPACSTPRCSQPCSL